MNKASRAFLAAWVYSLAAGSVFAAGPGTSAANFLKIPVGARETALGGAFTAVADNPNAIFYNPGGLGLLAAPELSYAYNNYLPGISQQWLAFARPARYGSWGLGLNYLNVSAFDSYDAADNRTGSVSAYDAAVFLGWGGKAETSLPLLASAGYGAALKYIRQSLDGRSASGFAADAGLLLSPGVRGLKLGLGVENAVSSRLDFIGSGARPARKFKTGASYYMRGHPISALFSADLNFPEDGPSYLSAGIENTLYGLLSLRAGYSSFGDLSSGLNFGLGLGLPSRGGRELRLDYAYGSTYDLGNVHKLAVSCRFAGPASAAAAEPAPAAKSAVAAQAEEFSGRLEELYGEDTERALAAAEALGAQNKPGVMVHFEALLSSGKTGWKLAAVRGLSVSSGEAADGLLARALRDQDPEVRRQAALALGSRPGPAPAALLEEALRKEESELVKGALLEALLKTKAP
ncbi:MAG TPA: hypothetical protein DEQ38_00320 [Elusimicrobia bacterium]|nr:MAG: hypothetical protein A2089_12135 [Elusimicrobia bacterium GWD2_63_28]HCC46557.1 hypothetical protein [Elusimicrobiota bacterium]